jgi:hypothetical protein
MDDVRSWEKLIHSRNVEKTILHQGIEHGGVQYLRLSNMQFLQNVSTSAASAGVLTQPRPIADKGRIEIPQRSSHLTPPKWRREPTASDLDTIDPAVLVQPRARRYRRNGVSEAWHVSPTLLAWRRS